MKTFKVLKIIDRFKGVFERAGIDYEMMRVILEIKLLMDGRRIPTIMGSQKNKGDGSNDGNHFIKSLWIYLLIGLFLIPLVIMSNHFLYQMALVFGILMFMLMTSMVSDFSSVLLDVRDKNIIFTKPVDRKTIHMAKFMHIIIYLSLITIAMIGPSLIASLIKFGIFFFFIYLFETILLNVFIVVLSALLYFVILKYFDGEVLKDVINYFQIALTIVMSVGYQLIRRVFQVIHYQPIFQAKWWQFFIPPIWFGGFFELLYHKNFQTEIILLATLSFVIPLISIILYIKLMPAFENNLQKLNNHSTRRRRKRKGFMDALSKWTILNQEERAFYKFTVNMIRNEHEFKLKVYPTIGLAIAFPLLIVFSQLGFSSFEEIMNSKQYFAIYFCALFVPATVDMIKYSANYKGAWLFKVLPIKNGEALLKGSIKAIILNLITPIYFFFSLVFIGIFGIRILPDLCLVFLNLLVFTLISNKCFECVLPFTLPYDAIETSNVGMTILLFIGLSIQAGIHFFSSYFFWGRVILALLLIVTNFVLWRVSFKKVGQLV